MPSPMVPGGEDLIGEDEIKGPKDLDKLGNGTSPPPPPPLPKGQVEMLNRQRLKTMTNVSDRLYSTSGLTWVSSLGLSIRYH